LWATSTPEVLLIKVRRPSIEILPAFDLLFAIESLSVSLINFFPYIFMKGTHMVARFV